MKDIPILGLLGLIFITLKLTQYIDWSWWYVLLPFWGGIVLIVLVIFIYGLIQLYKPPRTNLDVVKEMWGKK